VPAAALRDAASGEASDVVRARVEAARMLTVGHIGEAIGYRRGMDGRW
jgi:hypothetical protein